MCKGIYSVSSVNNRLRFTENLQPLRGSIFCKIIAYDETEYLLIAHKKGEMTDTTVTELKKNSYEENQNLKRLIPSTQVQESILKQYIMKTFQVNKFYYTFLNSWKMYFQVVARTENSVTIKDLNNGEIKEYKINLQNSRIHKCEIITVGYLTKVNLRAKSECEYNKEIELHNKLQKALENCVAQIEESITKEDKNEWLKKYRYYQREIVFHFMENGPEKILDMVF